MLKTHPDFHTTIKSHLTTKQTKSKHHTTQDKTQTKNKPNPNNHSKQKQNSHNTPSKHKRNKNKLSELTQLAQEHKADIITIQESKLTKTSKTPTIPNYTTLRKDRTINTGGGLITFVKNDITFTENCLPVTTQ